MQTLRTFYIFAVHTGGYTPSIVVEMLKAIKESEENYKREQEQARTRDKQLRSARQTSRSDINLYPTLANSTPIRNSNTRSDQPGVHFNANPVRHVYATTSDGGNQYEPPENDSILQGATSSPVDQFTTNATDIAGCNEPWRCNNTTSTSSTTINHRTATRPTSHNGLQNDNLPSRPDLRNGPICFRYGEQGHMRAECRERVFSTTAEVTTTTQKHVENNITTSQAPPTVK